MLVSQLKGKKIAIVGMGLTGQSCARFLLRHGISATGFDTRALSPAQFAIPCVFGSFKLQQFNGFDVLIVSPGISLQTPAIESARQQGATITSDIELFAANFAQPIVAVTGSNGKSTVVSMLQAIFKKAHVKVACGGNIGLPVLDLLQDEYEIAVLELSSFQLETAQSLPLKAAAILNVCEDHMDRYPDFEAYCAAKKAIFNCAEFKVASSEDENTWPTTGSADTLITSKPIANGFGLQMNPAAVTLNAEPYIIADELKISGLHNLLNVQAACIIAHYCCVSDESIRSALREFDGLPHRCQLVSKRNDVTWINDSKATNVGATIAAIQGLRPLVTGALWLIAGGDSKQADLSPLQAFLKNDVDNLITLGKDGPLLAHYKTNSIAVASMQDAVTTAAQNTHSGDMVLLSPACASLDMFDNYQHRGDVFTEAVEGLV